MNTNSILDLITLLGNVESLKISQVAIQEEVMNNLKSRLKSSENQTVIEDIENYTAIIREAAFLDGFISGVKLLHLINKL